MTSFEQALAEGGPLVAAWDHEDDQRTRLVLFRPTPGGARRLAETDVPLSAHEDMVDSLAVRGVRIGATYAGSGFVWIADDLGYSVWSDSALASSGAVASPAVSAVHVFYDSGDRGHRGVRLDLRSGGSELVAEERSAAARLDITYGQDNLYQDTLWAHYLSLHLAIWHLVPLVNDVSPTNIEPDLNIARAARALATSLAKQPVSGESAPLVQSAGAVGRATELSLAVSPGAANDSVAVEVRVVAKTGANLRRTIKQGTREQVELFLRRVTTPSAAKWAMNALLNALS